MKIYSAKISYKILDFIRYFLILNGIMSETID